MERDPKLPRVWAFLTLWLQRKHRAKPWSLQLPAPSPLASPVSTAATSRCHLPLLPFLPLADASHGCSGHSGLLFFLCLLGQFVVEPLEEADLSGTQVLLCWRLVCAASQALGAGHRSPES